MNIKSFITKSNTLISGSEINMGLNPVADLFYGDGFSRFVFKIDITELKERYNNNEFPIFSNLKHKIKFFNYGRFEKIDGNEDYNFGISNDKKRTSSFNLKLSEVDNFDEGNGFNQTTAVSTTPSNWYKPTLSSTGWTKNILIGYTEVFENGFEDLIYDITDYINSKIIDLNSENILSLQLSFSSSLETSLTEVKQYVGFFTNNANSVYKPYLETSYNVQVNDDRNDFYLDKENKLYFYFNIGGKLTNLDSLPTCEVNGTGLTVTHEYVGCYSVKLDLSSTEYEFDTMMYDIWDNIIYKGRHLKQQEKSFVLKDSNDYYNSSSNIEYKPFPVLSGIKINETLRKNDIIKMNLISKIPYTVNQMIPTDLVEYRIYIKDYNMEEVVIDWMPIHKTNNETFFILDTKSLLKGKHYIDIKYTIGNEEKYYYEVLSFNII